MAASAEKKGSLMTSHAHDSNPQRRRRPSTVLLTLLVCTLVSWACGGGGGGGDSAPPPVPPTFTPSSTTPAANLVTMTGNSTGSNQVELQVNLGGPTTAQNIYGFAFDLLLSNPSLVQVVSATAGDALSGDKTASAALNGSRITVAVSKFNQAAGNGVPGTNAVVVRLVLRTLTQGSTTLRFVGSTPSTNAADAAALDPNAAKINTVTFDSASSTLTQG